MIVPCRHDQLGGCGLCNMLRGLEEPRRAAGIKLRSSWSVEVPRMDYELPRMDYAAIERRIVEAVQLDLEGALPYGRGVSTSLEPITMSLSPKSQSKGVLPMARKAP